MENDDDGEKPQVFLSECTSVVFMCCTQQHQLFSSFSSSSLSSHCNEWRCGENKQDEMCAELLNVQIMKKFFFLLWTIEMMATHWNKLLWDFSFLQNLLFIYEENIFIPVVLGDLNCHLFRMSIFMASLPMYHG